MHPTSRWRTRVLDILIFILLVFPIVGGGFWISRPHLKIELTETAVPALIVFVVAYFLRDAVRESWFVRKATQAFDRWRAALLVQPFLTLAAGTLFMTVLWSYTALRRHWDLHSNAFDLGIFTNAIWNLTHGYGYISSVKGGMNLFADHQSPIFWGLAPLFRIFPSPETLLVAQAAGLACGAAAVYALGRQYKRRLHFLVAALPILYWIYLPVRRANLFDFHPEIFMLPLFLWAIAGIQARTPFRNLLGWVSFLAALACKESAGPLATGIGLAWILGAAPGGRPRWMSGTSAILLGLAAFFIDLKLVPHFLGAHYAYGSFYEHLKLGPAEWVRSLLGWSRIKFLLATLAPLAFLPLLAPRALVAVLPAYLMLFLSAGNLRLSPQFHYGIEPAVGLFWALAAATAVPPRLTIIREISLPVWVLFWSLLCFGRSEVYWIRLYEPDSHTQWIHERLLPCLASSPSFTASGALVPQIATRHWIQLAPNLKAAKGAARATNDCVWVDQNVDPWPLSPQQRDAWEKQLTEKLGYALFFQCHGSRVYQRQNDPRACLSCLPACP